MKNNEISIWIVIAISITCLILFGFLVGWNSKEITISEILVSNASTTLLGAITGAILGAVGTHKTTSIIKNNQVEKLKLATYEEAKHIQSYLCRYLYNVVKEYEKLIIDLNEPNEVLHGPSLIDFSVIKALQMELIKEHAVPSGDQRLLVHNLENHIDSIYKNEETRVINSGNLRYIINDSVSKTIIHRLSGVIFHLENFINKKDNFRFEEPNDETSLSVAFKVSNILNKDELIKKISDELSELRNEE